MTNTPPLRRLIDLQGVKDLEYQAVLKRDFAEPESRAAYPEIDALIAALFGITGDEAQDADRPTDWDDIEDKAPAAQAAIFQAEGWDVTDDKRRPLRVLSHLAGPLALAVRGVAGSLPFQPESKEPEGWAAGLAAEANRFRKR